MAESVAPQMNRKMEEPVAARVPQSSSSPSLPKMTDEVQCNHVSVCSSAQLIIQNHTNFKASAAPARCMFFHGGSWVDFQGDVVESWRSAFHEEKPAVEVEIGGAKYLLDFLRMIQIDLESGRQRSISWIDQNGKPFFPKVFVDEDFFEGQQSSGNPKIKIDILFNGLDDDGKRKREVLDMDGFDIEVRTLNKNKKHEEEEVDSKRPRLTSAVLDSLNWPNVSLLREEDRQYMLISNLFLSEIRKVDCGVTITAIHRWQGTSPLQKPRLEAFQRQIEITKAARGVSNAVFAWYAAPASAVPDILAQGFGLPSNISVSPAYGVGLYLSPLGFPHLSAMQLEADKNGEKHIILCRVILGKVEKMEESQQRSPSGADFDTGADDPKNPKWYVVWSTNMNTHIIPEGVVSFKSSTNFPGQLGSQLLSKVMNCVPSSKAQELLTLYDTYMAGKLVKEEFMKQMWAIAGGEMIMSIIRDFQMAG